MVRDIARQFVHTWGGGKVTEAEMESGPHEAHFLKLDSSKAVALLGWQPLLAAERRLQWTVDWYKAWQEDSNSIWDYSKQQIQLAEMKISQLASFAKSWIPDRSERHSEPPSLRSLIAGR